ncbi:MAG: hypothetical protein ACREFO_03125 [Acetobacteraceae bacterium]
MRNHPPKEAKTARLAREAGELRANLAKRKAQARKRALESGVARPTQASAGASQKPG